MRKDESTGWKLLTTPSIFFFKFLSVCFISLNTRLGLIANNKFRKVWFHSTLLVKFQEVL